MLNQYILPLNIYSHICDLYFKTLKQNKTTKHHALEKQGQEDTELELMWMPRPWGWTLYFSGTSRHHESFQVRGKPTVPTLKSQGKLWKWGQGDFTSQKNQGVCGEIMYPINIRSYTHKNLNYKRLAPIQQKEKKKSPK